MESKLQTKIRKDIEKKWYVVKIGICNKPGFPDLMIMNKGRVAFLEIKAKGKKPEPLQLHRHRELTDKGFEVFVIDSWECYLQIKYHSL